jgi:hypothetical protein
MGAAASVAADDPIVSRLTDEFLANNGQLDDRALYEHLQSIVRSELPPEPPAALADGAQAEEAIQADGSADGVDDAEDDDAGYERALSRLPCTHLQFDTNHFDAEKSNRAT